MKVNILLIGANLCNRGAESMLLTLISRIQRDIPDANCVASSYAPDDEEKVGMISHADPNGIKIKFELIFNRKTFGLLFLQSILCIAPTNLTCAIARKLSPFISRVQDAEVVIDISGFALTAHRPWWRHLIYLMEARTAFSFGIPFLAMTQSFGPFVTSWQKLVARSALRRAKMISARGRASAFHLESIGLTEDDHFMVAPDITYLFDPAPPEYADDILQGADRPRIAIIPNTNVYRQSGGKGWENPYIQSLTELCRYAIDEYDCHLVFIPHEGYASRFDDLSLVTLVRKDATINASSSVLDADMPVSVIKSVILRCDAVITSRYHGMMAAISGGVPAFVLGWAEKYHESAQMAGISGFTFNFHESDPELIMWQFNDFWEKREDIRQSLLENLPQNRMHSDQAISAMVKTIKSSLRRH